MYGKFEYVVPTQLNTDKQKEAFTWLKENVSECGKQWEWEPFFDNKVNFGFLDSAAALMFALTWAGNK
jgi:hypothetical protein